MNDSRELVRELATWRRNIRRFLLASTITRETDSAGIPHDVIRYRQVTGRESVVALTQVVDTRRRVIGLALEARRRRRAKDWSWFHWLAEMRKLTRVALFDDFDEVHGATIDRAVMRRDQVRAASKAGAAKRRAIGERTAKRLAKTAAGYSRKDAARAASISPRQERRRRRGK